MKSNRWNDNGTNPESPISVKSMCFASCRKILAQIKKAKDAIFAESRNALATQERLLRLTLNEAEALACQTLYPNLVFPVQDLAVWNAHQQSLRRRNRISA